MKTMKGITVIDVFNIILENVFIASIEQSKKWLLKNGTLSITQITHSKNT